MQIIIEATVAEKQPSISMEAQIRQSCAYPETGGASAWVALRHSKGTVRSAGQCLFD